MILDIDNILGKPKNRIVRVGLELEGAWNQYPKGVRNLEVDRSVFKNNIPDGHVTGELPSGPIVPFFISKFIKKSYPQKVDHTCGLHLHMSFESPRYYSILMEDDYNDTMKDQIRKWVGKEGFPPEHHIWERLAGKSIYCQDKFWPDLQMNNDKKDYDKERKGHRYTIINYCARLKTIEIRVLPMMETPEQSIRAIRMLIDTTNACIFILGRRKEAKSTSKVYFKGDDVDAESYEFEVPIDPKLKRMIERQ